MAEFSFLVFTHNLQIRLLFKPFKIQFVYVQWLILFVATKSKIKDIFRLPGFNFSYSRI
jgi:hypothetical protein